MTVKTIFRLLIFVSLYGCSDNSDSNAKRTGQSQFGLYIENGPRQGFQYFDSTNTQYNYRYYTMKITNDSIIPIHLEINFSDTGDVLNDSCKSKVFLLPRHLTYEELHIDKSILMELKRFFALEIDRTAYLNEILKPTEKFILTFGVLTNTKYPDPTTPFDTKLLTSKEDSSTILFRLKINDTLIIPCGHFKYIEN